MPMAQSAYLSNAFLIAMPGLADPNFFHTVTYMCEHTSEGALGIVINRPLDIQLRELLEDMEIEITVPMVGDTPIYLGGPVQPERGFVLHEPLGEWEATMPITERIGLTSSQDIIAAIAAGLGPARFLIALGYAGWGEGQLEHELMENAWLSGPADGELIFETPSEQRWEAAAALLGVDLQRLSSDVGHA